MAKARKMKKKVIKGKTEKQGTKDIENESETRALKIKDTILKMLTNKSWFVVLPKSFFFFSKKQTIISKVLSGQYILC